MIDRFVSWKDGFRISSSLAEARANREYQSVGRSDLDVSRRQIELTKHFGNGWFSYVSRDHYLGTPLGRGCIKLY